MRQHLQLVADSPRSIATISLHGTLSRAGAARIIRAVAALPQHVRSTHLDLGLVRLLDVAALDVLVDAMNGWASDRQGVVSITPPCRPTLRDMFVARPWMNRDPERAL